MTKFLEDILRQPEELLRTIDHLLGSGRKSLDSAASTIRNARHVYITGIGASWNAALNAGALFHSAGKPVFMLEAAELLHFSSIPRDAVVLALSRSGRSVEIVKLLTKARLAGAAVIGVTNFEDGLLARGADISVVVPVKADYGVSVNTYSTLGFAAAAIASAATGSFDTKLAVALSQGIVEAGKKIPVWQQQLAHTSWLVRGVPYYFLARGSSLGSAYEASLLWEECAKSPSKAMGTSSFRHGPQEIVTKDMRFGIWIDGEFMRMQDQAVAADLRELGASVMLLGHDLSKDATDLVFELPKMPSKWQFLVDIFPVQLAAESFARISGVDCDSFRFASYIVEDDQGILLNGTAL